MQGSAPPFFAERTELKKVARGLLDIFRQVGKMCVMQWLRFWLRPKGTSRNLSQIEGVGGNAVLERFGAVDSHAHGKRGNRALSALPQLRVVPTERTPAEF